MYVRALVWATVAFALPLHAQTQSAHPGLTGPQVLALSVPDLEAATQWYQMAFGPFRVRDLPPPDSTVRTRLLQSDELFIELSWHQRARSLREYAGAPTPTFLVHGVFKAAWFVRDIDATVAELGRRGVQVGPIRSDSTEGLRMAFLRDASGTFLQLLQRTPR